MLSSIRLASSQRNQVRLIGYGNILWMLWVFMGILPWVIPTHTQPWPAFYSELLWSFTFLSLAFWASIASAVRWQIHWPEFAIALAACIPVVQGMFGLLIFPDESILILGYILTLALAITVGRRMHFVSRYACIDWLFISVGIAASISTALAAYQWCALDELGLMVPAMAKGAGRAVANIGQSNNLSTLLVWGLVTLWWAYERRALRKVSVFVVSLFLLIGISLTGSRTGWIQIALLGFLVAACGPKQGRLQRVTFIAILAAWFVVLLVALPYASEALWGLTTRTSNELSSAGLRVQFWMMSLDAINQSPWIGYGWNQTLLVNVAFANAYPNLGEAMGHSHNIVLDLFIWNGVPLGLIIVAFFVFWIIRCIHISSSQLQYVLLSFVGIFLIHAMLELPHVYVYFLIPVGIVLGCIDSIKSRPPIFCIGRGFTCVTVLIALLVVVKMFFEYGKIESYVTARGMMGARIYGVVIPDLSNIYVLRSIRLALEHIYTEPIKNMSEENLDELRKVSIRYPTSGAPFRYAKTLVMNERPEDAGKVLDMICNMHSPSVCDAARKEIIISSR